MAVATRLRLIDAAAAGWDAFNSASPQGSPFTTSRYLAAACPDTSRFLVVDDERVIAAVPVINDRGQAVAPPVPYTPYHGLLFAADLWALPQHSRVPVLLEVTEFVLHELENRFASFSLSLHPSITDVRGFQWFHYNDTDQRPPNIAIRYTGIIDLRQYEMTGDYRARLRTNRRRDLARSHKAGLRVTPSVDASQLVALLDETFGRQGLAIDERDRQILLNVIAAVLDDGSGRLVFAVDEHGATVGGTLFIEHGETLYYLIGATSLVGRDLRANTLLFVDNVEWALSKGKTSVDTVGVNSPQRGDFKVSLGADPTPYYVIRANCAK